MARKKYYGKKYSSKDEQIDWVFRRFLWLLENKINQIVFITPLRDPDIPKAHLRGLWSQEEKTTTHGKKTIVYEKLTIYIDPKRHEKIGGNVMSTFIHELTHVLFPTIPERNICQEENILFKRFSEIQKRVLKKFLPK